MLNVPAAYCRVIVKEPTSHYIMSALLPISEVTSEFMPEVYIFSGAKQFTSLPGSNNKTFQASVKSFHDSISQHVFAEFPIQFLSKWYNDIPELRKVFGKDCKVVENSKHVLWDYRLLVLNPKADATTKNNITKANKVEWAQTLAINFLTEVFNTNVDDGQSILSAVLLEYTLLIVACRREEYKGKKPKPTHSLYEVKDKVMVLAAACYRPGSRQQIGMAFLTWMAVAKRTARLPQGVESWRRLGIGRFLIVLIIKRLTMALLHHNGKTVNDKVLSDVVIFLQSTTPHAFQFYGSCGFRQINRKNENNRELLPESLRERVEGERGNGWWVNVLGADQQVPRLLCLPAGEFMRKPDVINLVDSPSQGSNTLNQASRACWCRYPPSNLAETCHLRPTDLDLQKVFLGMDLLLQLLPSPTSALLPPSSLHLNGEMLMSSRKDHGIMKGKGWMSTGELEMMTALLMRDGRYDEGAAIIPFSMVNTIETAFLAYKKACLLENFRKDFFRQNQEEMHVKFQQEFGAPPRVVMSVTNKLQTTETKEKAVEFVTKWKEAAKSQFSELVKEKLKATEDNILNSWKKHQTFILKNVLSVYPSIMQKKVIVFPKNLNNAHWMVTFVFNPSSIHRDFAFRQGLRPCFYRYCSQNPSGTRKVKIQQGLLWFLNLAYSHTFHRIVHPSGVHSMNWETPYGYILDGNLVGSSEFPSLRLQEEDKMPKQSDEDDYNCGIGVVATIAIVLRDCIGRDPEDDLKFIRNFSTRTLEVSFCETSKEHICSFPPGSFKPLPLDRSLFGKTYLHLLREQWFIVFDRLAKLQHVTLGKRSGTDFKVDEEYEACSKILEQSKWPALATISKPPPAPVCPLPLPSIASIATAPSPTTPPAQPQHPLPKPPQPLQNSLPQPREPPQNPTAPQAPPQNPLPSTTEPPQNPPPQPREPPQNALPQPPAPVVKQWDHIAVSNGGDEDDPSIPDDINKLWPPTPKAIVIPDDWDGKKELNNWNCKWKENNNGDPKFFFGDEPEEEVEHIHSCYEGALTEEGVENFTKKWYNSTNNPQQRPVPKLDQKMMEKFVDYSFRNWGWSSNKQYEKDLEEMRKEMNVEMGKAKTDRTRMSIYVYYTELLKAMKKERRHFRKQFQVNYKLGNPAAVHGLKYDRDTNTFTARCVYKTPNKESGDMEEIEEEMEVSEEWLKLAGFADGIVQHVINMNSGTGFIPVPEGKEILMNTRKVVRVKYVPPTSRWLVDTQAVRDKAKKLRAEESEGMLKEIASESGKQGFVKNLTRNKHGSSEIESFKKVVDDVPMKEVISDGYWQVVFSDNSTPMRTDESFVKENFREAYIQEMKRVKRGFVDIPVGDYKASHLAEHPNLHIHGAPKVNFPQTDGQDLCVSKSLASALYAIGFQKEAHQIDEYGLSELQGGAVDSFAKVSRFARDVLPSWIVRRCVKKPSNYNWQLHLDKTTILLGVLNASDGNCSHAVTVHGGFIYDANEVVSLPLCQEALDYCTSTATERSTFIDFRRIDLFFYEGKQREKLQRLTLQMETDEQEPQAKKTEEVGTKRKFQEFRFK